MSATNDSAYQYTKIGADAEQAARKAAEDNLPVDMMNDRRMQSYAGLWGIIGAKAAATVVLAEAREQFEQDIAEAEKRGAVEALTYAAEITRRSAAELAAATGTPLVEGVVLGIATSLDQYARQIESGEVALP